ncbi:arsenic resistance N-acetyltransferase ArsN2 [Mucilaginibacter sp. PPCGB 2223]|uniref:arsenic resistance N-acetyltransferase ArsN2 n=1 Tax=Mucilaginibacter sp. PPCGB 2223 TaxID=1886027 RepID=UPI00158642E9|nr:arsenic resistance N-acetyltransferase ArsN2 [Mucilaginibacter sp. PPCGB 2223]
MQIERATPYRNEIIALLQAEGLPFADLPEDLGNFVVILDDRRVIGSAGLEIYGSYGLLRSLAVSKSFRNNGIGNQLLNEVETSAGVRGLAAIYLLTETAPAYFKQKGYKQIERAAIPVAVQRSSEFSHVCPVSAIAMKKDLK